MHLGVIFILCPEGNFPKNRWPCSARSFSDYYSGGIPAFSPKGYCWCDNLICPAILLVCLYRISRLFYPACSYFRQLKTDGFRLPKNIFGGINTTEETDTSDRGKAKDRGKALRQSLHVYSLQFTLSTFHFSKTISRRYSVTALQRYIKLFHVPSSSLLMNGKRKVKKRMTRQK